MDIEKFVQRLSDSPEFRELLDRAAREAAFEELRRFDEEHEDGHVVRRRRLMEPELAEGEWQLNAADHVGEDVE